MVNYDKAKLGSMVEKLDGDDEETFPDEDDNINWDVGEDEAAM